MRQQADMEVKKEGGKNDKGSGGWLGWMWGGWGKQKPVADADKSVGEILFLNAHIVMYTSFCYFELVIVTRTTVSFAIIVVRVQRPFGFPKISSCCYTPPSYPPRGVVYM